jgi:hypothetical protein
MWIALVVHLLQDRAQVLPRFHGGNSFDHVDCPHMIDIISIVGLTIAYITVLASKGNDVDDPAL